MTKLSESEKFNDLDINRLARQVRQNDGRANRGIVYQDDKRYNDYQGEKWLDVRSKDKKTLIAAILDGMSEDTVAKITGVTRYRIGLALERAEEKVHSELQYYGRENDYARYNAFLRKVADSLTDMERLKKMIIFAV